MPFKSYCATCCVWPTATQALSCTVSPLYICYGQTNRQSYYLIILIGLLLASQISSTDVRKFSQFENYNVWKIRVYLKACRKIAFAVSFCQLLSLFLCVHTFNHIQAQQSLVHGFTTDRLTGLQLLSDIRSELHLWVSRALYEHREILSPPCLTIFYSFTVTYLIETVVSFTLRILRYHTAYCI